MQEQSTITILKKIAESTGREIYYTEQPYESSFYNRVILHKRTVYLPGDGQRKTFLIGFSDPKKFDSNEIFFGVFFPVRIPADKKLLIRKKDILDRMNPFAGKDAIKSGIPFFDRNTVIKGNDTALINFLFNEPDNAKVILNSLQLFDAVRVGFNEVDIDFIPEFKETSNFGIFSLQKWILDTRIIEALFQNVESIADGLMDTSGKNN
jgi:hypothetical protein